MNTMFLSVYVCTISFLKQCHLCVDTRMYIIPEYSPGSVSSSQTFPCPIPIAFCIPDFILHNFSEGSHLSKFSKLQISASFPDRISLHLCSRPLFPASFSRLLILPSSPYIFPGTFYPTFLSRFLFFSLFLCPISSSFPCPNTPHLILFILFQNSVFHFIQQIERTNWQRLNIDRKNEMMYINIAEKLKRKTGGVGFKWNTSARPPLQNTDMSNFLSLAAKMSIDFSIHQLRWTESSKC